MSRAAKSSGEINVSESTRPPSSAPWLVNSNRLFSAESVFVTLLSAGRFFASKSTKYVSRQR